MPEQIQAFFISLPGEKKCGQCIQRIYFSCNTVDPINSSMNSLQSSPILRWHSESRHSIINQFTTITIYFRLVLIQKYVLKFGFSEKATKFDKKFCHTFDKSIVFCAHNRVLIKNVLFIKNKIISCWEYNVDLGQES